MKNKSIVKNILSVTATVLIGAVIYYVLRKQDWSVLRTVTYNDILICSLFVLCSYTCSGIQYCISLRKIGCPFALWDILFFPFMLSFWGLIIPFQGSSLFSMFYLKKKYCFQVTKTVAIILFLYLFNILFASVAGLTYCIYFKSFNGLLFVFSLFSLFSPLYLWAVNRLLKSKFSKLLPLPAKIKDMLEILFSSMNQLFSDLRNIALLLVFQVIRQLCQSMILTLVAVKLNHSAHWLWGYLVAVSQELSIIIKITPGNIGINEAVSAFVSQLTGVPPSVGLMGALFATVLSLVWILLIGGVQSLVVICKYGNFLKEKDDEKKVE